MHPQNFCAALAAARMGIVRLIEPLKRNERKKGKAAAERISTTTCIGRIWYGVFFTCFPCRFFVTWTFFVLGLRDFVFSLRALSCNSCVVSVVIPFLLCRYPFLVAFCYHFYAVFILRPITNHLKAPSNGLNTYVTDVCPKASTAYLTKLCQSLCHTADSTFAEQSVQSEG